MGVEHFLVCYDCKQYIDLHKAYSFDRVLKEERPAIGIDDTGSIVGDYWDTRGLWFIWNHRSHDLKMNYDSCEEWYDLKPKLEEVFPYEEDLKLRETKY